MSNPRLRMSAVGLVYFGLFLLSMFLHRFHPMFIFPKPGPGFWLKMVLDLGVGVAAGALVSLICFAAHRSSKTLQKLSEEFRMFLGPLAPTDRFFMSAFSAIGEEFFFRGVVQSAIGLIPASLIFGAFHIGPGRRFLLWTGFAIGMGWLLGSLYIWRGNLLTPTLAHFTVNFLNFHLLYRTRKAAEG